MAYERVTGPLGPRRIDIAAAIIASTVANANRGKNTRRLKVEDFIPEWDQRVQSDEEMWAAIREAHTAMGGETRNE